MQNDLSVPTALTIAGSDPSGGAGIEADLRVFGLHGLFAGAVSTLQTVQDCAAVHRVDIKEAALFAEQLRRVLAERRWSVLKIGALGGGRIVQALCDALDALDRCPPIVLDPVIDSSSGRPLLDADGVEVLKRRLLGRVTIFTPNLPEAQRLVGAPYERWEMRRLGAALRALGPAAVVLKGGHDEDPLDAVDHVFSRAGDFVMRGRRIPGPAAHGTGCLFASSAASFLAKGASTPKSLRHAKACVTLGIEQGRALVGGPVFLRSLPLAT